MKSPRPNIAVFEQDACARGGYGYTATNRLSCRLATERSLSVILQMAEFKGRSVLDMGCGDGHFTIRIWDRARPRALAGVDAATAAISIACQNRKDRPIRFEVGDAHALAFPNDSFDLALLQSVLHHDESPWDVIREAFRVAPAILIHEPNGNNFGLKVIEKTSRYHREHGEKSYRSRQIACWIREAGGEIQRQTFAGFVPMFCPDWLARTMKAAEPVLEAMPMLRAMGCAVLVVAARRK